MYNSKDINKFEDLNQMNDMVLEKIKRIIAIEFKGFVSLRTSKNGNRVIIHGYKSDLERTAIIIKKYEGDE